MNQLNPKQLGSQLELTFQLSRSPAVATKASPRSGFRPRKAIFLLISPACGLDRKRSNRVKGSSDVGQHRFLRHFAYEDGDQAEEILEVDIRRLVASPVSLER